MKKIALVAVVLFSATSLCQAIVPSMPEIDPSSTSAGLVLLSGIALMLRGRKAK